MLQWGACFLAALKALDQAAHEPVAPWVKGHAAAHRHKRQQDAPSTRCIQAGLAAACLIPTYIFVWAL